MNECPFFSVIIPAYNCSQSIEATLDSISQQTFNNFELIIVDDGSTDNTRQVIADHPLSSKYIYQYQSNSGVCVARNNGAGIAKGNYLIFLDSDDLVKNTWLVDFYKVLINSDSDISFCLIQRKALNGDIKIVRPYTTDNGFGYGLFLSGAFTIRRQLFFDIGEYEENLKYGENTELSFRIKERNIKADFVNKPNLIYNQSITGGSKNLQNMIDSNKYLLRVHKHWFETRPKSKILFLRNTGVACIKLNRLKEGKAFLKKAWTQNPFSIKGLFRFVISNIPFLANKVWKTEDWQ